MGGYALTLLLSVAPALLLLWLTIRIDRARPEPMRLMLATFALGATASVPAWLLQFALHRAFGTAVLAGARFVDAFVVTAMTEESMKLAVVLAFVFWRREFNETLDGIVYCVCASLGFGLVENVLYAASDARTGILRAISAVPMHAVASGSMGFFVGRARFVSRASAAALIVAGYAVAVAIHGTYDWIVFMRGAFWFPFSLAVVAVSGLGLYVLARRALSLDDAMLGRHSLTEDIRSNWPVRVPDSIVPEPSRKPAVPTAPAPISSPPSNDKS